MAIQDVKMCHACLLGSPYLYLTYHITPSKLKAQVHFWQN